MLQAEEQQRRRQRSRCRLRTTSATRSHAPTCLLSGLKQSCGSGDAGRSCRSSARSRTGILASPSSPKHARAPKPAGGRMRSFDAPAASACVRTNPAPLGSALPVRSTYERRAGDYQCDPGHGRPALHHRLDADHDRAHFLLAEPALTLAECDAKRARSVTALVAAAARGSSQAAGAPSARGARRDSRAHPRTTTGRAYRAGSGRAVVLAADGSACCN